jgi:hypothetical protein
MGSSSREEIVEVLDALRAAHKRALDLTFDVLTTPERLAVLELCEQLRRSLPAVEHPLINQLAAQAGPTELGGRLAPVVANRLRISRAEASRRIHEAADLGERRALNGEALPPVLSATAAAQRNGDLGAGHVAVIRSFCHRLPDVVDIETRGKAEAQLARLGCEHRPDELAKLADTLTDCLNPDGDFSDIDRATRRGITLGRQGLDGMSAISGWLTPEARATWDAVLAKLAAPGMCNPADDAPCLSGTPSHHRILTVANPASTPTTTPKNSYGQKTTTKKPRDRTRPGRPRCRRRTSKYRRRRLPSASPTRSCRPWRRRTTHARLRRWRCPWCRRRRRAD